MSGIFEKAINNLLNEKAIFNLGESWKGFIFYIINNNNNI
jgi:hypothetical protein